MDRVARPGACCAPDGAPAPASEGAELAVAGMEIALEASPRSVPAARRWLDDALGPVSRYDAEVARLLLSELVTNALLHARTAMVVRVADDGGRLRVEVSDAGRTPSVPFAQRPAADREGGRGLQIVALLAADWGVRPNAPEAPGRTVWFELAAASEERALSQADDVSA